MSDPDIDALRQYRLADAQVPDGLQERIEERLWQSVMSEEARLRSGDQATNRRRWWDFAFQRSAAVATMVTAAAVVAVMALPGEISTSDPSRQEVGSTNLVGAAANSLFGNTATSASSPTVLIDAREQDHEVVAANPPALRDALVRVAADEGYSGNMQYRVAFKYAMSGVINSDLQPEARSMFVRALDDLEGVQPLQQGSDLLGRRGLIFGFDNSDSTVREQYVVDNRGNILEHRVFTTTYGNPACPPGTFASYSAFQDGVEIQPADSAWVAWPQVVPACDSI